MLSAYPIINENEEFREKHPIGERFLRTDYYGRQWWLCDYAEYIYASQAIVGVEVRYIRPATNKEIKTEFKK